MLEYVKNRFFNWINLVNECNIILNSECCPAVELKLAPKNIFLSKSLGLIDIHITKESM